MIRLIVDGYCENCPEFCADVEKTHVYTDELQITRVLESFEYESKMETLGKVSKALIDKGVLIDYKSFTELLDLEKENKK